MLTTIAAETTASGFTKQSGYHLGCLEPASCSVLSPNNFGERWPAKARTRDPMPDHALRLDEHSHERDQSTECGRG